MIVEEEEEEECYHIHYWHLYCSIKYVIKKFLKLLELLKLHISGCTLEKLFHT